MVRSGSNCEELSLSTRRAPNSSPAVRPARGRNRAKRRHRLHYWTTWSARASYVAGTVRPSAWLCADWICPPILSLSVFVSSVRLIFLLLALRSLFDLGNSELTVHFVGVELDLVSGLDLLEHRRVAGLKHHAHAIVHVELLERAVLDRDLTGVLVHLGH